MSDPGTCYVLEKGSWMCRMSTRKSGAGVERVSGAFEIRPADAVCTLICGGVRNWDPTIEQVVIEQNSQYNKM